MAEDPALAREVDLAAQQATRSADAGSRRLWQRAVDLWQWDVLMELGTVPAAPTDETLANRPGSVCLRVDVAGAEPVVLAGAERLLAEREHWAVMAGMSQLPASTLAGWAARYAVLVMDRRTAVLTRLPGRNPDLVTELRATRWLHQLDCLLVSPALAETARAA